MPKPKTAGGRAMIRARAFPRVKPEPTRFSPGDRFLKRAEVLRRLGISRSTLYELITRGEFPPPVKVGARGVVYPEAEVTAWQVAKLAEHDARAVAEHGARAAEGHTRVFDEHDARPIVDSSTLAVIERHERAQHKARPPRKGRIKR